MCVCVCVCMAILQSLDQMYFFFGVFFLPGSQTTIWLGSAQAFNPTPTPALLGGPPAVPRCDPVLGHWFCESHSLGLFFFFFFSRWSGQILEKIVGNIAGLLLQGCAHECTGKESFQCKWLKIEFRVKGMWWEKNNNGIVDLITRKPSVLESNQNWWQVQSLCKPSRFFLMCQLDCDVINDFHTVPSF